MNTAALTVRNLSKTFGATRALVDANLELRPGEVHALVGENGSGKSTLVKILAGFHTPDAGGEVSVNGESLHFGDPVAGDTLGMRFVHQDLGLVGQLDTMDNLALGHGYDVGRFKQIRWREVERAAREALDRLGYDIDVRTPLDRLSMSERTAVAVARALSARRTEARLLVLDEPTANLPGPEVERLFALLRRIRDTGVAILFISHHFNEVFSLAERVTVLRDGRIVATRTVSEIDDATLVELMIGRRLELADAHHQGTRTGDTLLRLSGVGGRVLNDLDLDVAAGEVVGVAGITGSGREELVPLIFGGRPRRGVVEVGGQILTPERPDLAVAAGMGCVPAERYTNAVLHDHTVRENVVITRPGVHVAQGLLRHSREKADVREWLELLDVRPRATENPIGTLSGGNQQKVMLARWFRTKPRVLILDEPTQGVDVAAQADIHELIDQAADQGVAVLVCSTESEELARLADRVIVLSAGRIITTLKAPADADRITAATLSTFEGAA